MRSTGPRPWELCRCWLFVPGADRRALTAAAASGADVIIQELEDFTAPERRPEARALAPEMFALWRRAGARAAVRINPLAGDGRADLAAVMRGRPEIVAMSKVAGPAEVAMLDQEVSRLEREYGLPSDTTKLAPNIESALGVMHAYAIARASPRVVAVIGSTEDLAADLGAERAPDAAELAYARARLHLECRAAGVVSVDCPYTFHDRNGLAADTRFARRLGYSAKSAVSLGHVATISRILTPSAAEVKRARAIVAAFERAQAGGQVNVRLGRRLIEVPIYLGAKRLLDRARALGVGDERD